MLQFNVSVIDLILVLCVVILTIMYLNITKKHQEEENHQSLTNDIQKQSQQPNTLFTHTENQNEYLNTDDTNTWGSN